MDAVSQYDIDAMMSDMMRYRDDNKMRSAAQAQASATYEQSYDDQDWQPPFWQAHGETGARPSPRTPAQPPSHRAPTAPTPSPRMSPAEMRAMSDCIDSLPLAMAYIPMQKWGKLYEPDVALSRGTLFPDLDKPFLAASGV